MTPMKPQQARMRFITALSAFALCLTALTAHAKTSTDASSSAVEKIRAIITDEARKTAVPSSLAIAVAQVESGLRSDHQGADGGRGLFQISPNMARDLDADPRKLWQPRANSRVGLKLLERLLNRAEGRWETALQAYSTRHGAVNGAAKRRYVADVLGWERRYAERLALADSLNARRREVLMASESHGYNSRGRDNWRQSDQPDTPEVASIGRDRLPQPEREQELAEGSFYAGEGDVDPMLDDDTDVAGAVRVYRSRDRVKITIYEEEYEVTPSAWRRPPPRWIGSGWDRPRPPRQFRSPGWSPRKAKWLKRRARNQARKQARRQSRRQAQVMARRQQW